jgi:hypothetical protein
MAGAFSVHGSDEQIFGVNEQTPGPLGVAYHAGDLVKVPDARLLLVPLDQRFDIPGGVDGVTRGYQKGTSRKASQASPARMIRLMPRMMYRA